MLAVALGTVEDAAHAVGFHLGLEPLVGDRSGLVLQLKTLAHTVG